MKKILDNIVTFLQKSKIHFDSRNDDGRVNSINSEMLIVELLKREFGRYIQVPSIRCWYDIKISSGDQEIFVNIKISDFSNGAADNISSKLGMGYALTGIKNMPIAWEKFNDMLADNLKIGCDYFFLVLDKGKLINTYWTSLKRINVLVPNGNNLPFQCNWATNTIFSQRSEVESMKYILNIYLKSWDKKTLGYPHKLRDMLKNDKLFNNE
ncbi:MAG: hypothetical protein LBS76_02505 [Mycoplasmataceae bacterium]|jgi:hypothetical protein|nr:hypothetical protein [Mycoplasmataceae bacterium]